MLFVVCILGLAQGLPQASSAWKPTDCQTVGECYAMAMDKSQNKLKRENAIAKLPGGGQAGLDALLHLLDASDSDTVTPIRGKAFGVEVSPGFVRFHAAQTLGSMGGKARTAAPRLAQTMISDPIVSVRQASAIAIGNIGSSNQTVIEALKNVLKSHDYFVWQSAVLAIGQIRPEDREAVGLLQALAKMTAPPPRLDFNSQIAVENAIVQAKTVLGGTRNNSPR